MDADVTWVSLNNEVSAFVSKIMTWKERKKERSDGLCASVWLRSSAPHSSGAVTIYGVCRSVFSGLKETDS